MSTIMFAASIPDYYAAIVSDEHYRTLLIIIIPHTKLYCFWNEY